MRKILKLIILMISLLSLIFMIEIYSRSLVSEDKLIKKELIGISELDIDETWKLPIIRLEKKNKESLDEYFYMDMYIYDDFSKDAFVINSPSHKYESKIKYRGSSSAKYPKKQLKISIQNKGNDFKNSTDLLGMPIDSKWVMHGPYFDKSYMRNKIMYDIFRKELEWAPRAEYCEVFIDSEYAGIYLLVESIEKSKNRLNLRDYGMLNGQIPYIVKRDRVDDEFKVIQTFGSLNNYTINNLILLEPNPNKIVRKHRDWIIDSISDFEKALYGEGFKNIVGGYSRYIDVENFIDYYVISLFSANEDAGDLSTFIYKDLDQPIKIVPWDYNNSFGNTSKEDYTYFSDERYNWYSRLLEDPYFRKRVVSRYEELRLGILSDESFEKLVVDNKIVLEHASLRNTKRWYTSSKSTILNKATSEDLYYEEYYDERVNRLITFAKARGKFLDENLEIKLDSIFNKD